jgi:hypothetical protein
MTRACSRLSARPPPRRCRLSAPLDADKRQENAFAHRFRLGPLQRAGVDARERARPLTAREAMA